MTKSKFGMKEQPKAVKKEPNLRELVYTEKQNLTLNGQEFMYLMHSMMDAVSRRGIYANVINQKGEVIGQSYGQSGQDDDLVAINNFIATLHKQFVNEGLAVHYSELKKETENAK